MWVSYKSLFGHSQLLSRVTMQSRKVLDGVHFTRADHDTGNSMP